jgi:hypothetical protein
MATPLCGTTTKMSDPVISLTFLGDMPFYGQPSILRRLLLQIGALLSYEVKREIHVSNFVKNFEISPVGRYDKLEWHHAGYIVPLFPVFGNIK